MNVYWILSAFPLVLETGWGIYSLCVETRNSSLGIVLLLVWLLIIMPMYLLLVNIIYINKKFVTYTLGIICMFGIIVLGNGIIMLHHKIQFGTFIGDVPEGLYFLFIGIPTAVVVTGIIIYYFIKSRNH